ncbi:MAG: DUF4870 domain-containing protein [Thermoplasmatales archaeon]|nr:MAG: DUF4870 domain-containing protein [Thermoplasmatales archaeon]
MAKTSLDLGENIEGALCYLVGWITGIVFYIVEKDNKFVKFHAMQSILVFLPLTILAWIFGGFFGAFAFWSGLWFLWWISGLIWIIAIILWLILMLKAYQGEKFKLPVVGDIAEKNS